jgi:hypothetical protein
MRPTLCVLTLLACAAPAAAQDHSMRGMSMSSPLHEPGQSAFAAIQEVVAQLEADPNTEWSRVNIERLRQHLIDMDEVTMHAAVRVEQIRGGERYTVTGANRTLQAIQNMVIGHANAMGAAEHWTMTAVPIPQGAVVTVMAREPADLVRIHALGLIGMIAEGAHHQPHHWMLARGDNPHG